MDIVIAGGSTTTRSTGWASGSPRWRSCSSGGRPSARWSGAAGLPAGSDVVYPMPAPEHPLVGRFLAELPEASAVRARPVQLDPTGGLRVRHGRVDVVPCEGDEAVLVRPDGYVAWAGTPDETLDAALETWFCDCLDGQAGTRPTPARMPDLTKS
ncbi:hypothetical protein ABZ897_48235 [Nonomuraea sp. NPDC046802]|uniref:aromatic-ring hydroxylase C-terminal domain-containing protein n=1 Tax=Nonomuraea sp. NPDC046802 TaxID=3154919 RepID=UPI00340BCFA6